jgi:alpha-L-fucosidase 2
MVIFYGQTNVSRALILALEVLAKRSQMDKGIHVGSWGQFQGLVSARMQLRVLTQTIVEWKFDMDSPTDMHRHLSHLVGLYPGYATASYNASLQPAFLPSGKLANYTTTQVMTAVNTSLTHRGNGTADSDAGWEKVWRAACWAQLGYTDIFYHELSVRTSASTCAGDNM